MHDETSYFIPMQNNFTFISFSSYTDLCVLTKAEYMSFFNLLKKLSLTSFLEESTHIVIQLVTM